MVDRSTVTKEKGMARLTRRKLLEQVRVLSARVGATETRKNLRQRVARLAAERDEALKLVKQTQADALAMRQRLEAELADCRQAALMHGASAGNSSPGRCAHGVWKSDHCWSCNPDSNGGVHGQVQE